MIGETTVLITGKRGNGKSLKAVSLMAEEISAGRLVFASNFNGLRLQGVQTLDDPRQWETLPAGSILFVDEAQRYWRSRRSGDPPPEVQAMETQRHLGITIVLLTQQPTYLDKHIRGLVDRHHHLMLAVGGKASRMWTWARCMDDPEEANTRAEGDESVFVFPKQHFGDYDSAEVHTIKAKIPRKVWLIAGAAVVVAALGWNAYGAMQKHVQADAGQGTEAGVLAAGDTPAPPSPRGHDGRRKGYATAEEYAIAAQPLIPAMPWTAPMFNDRPVESDPRVFCMVTADGLDGEGNRTPGRCRCVTEQGSLYGMPQIDCQTLARYGEPYNPYRKPADRAQAMQPQHAGVSPAGAIGASAPMPTVVGADAQPFGTVTSYGQMGVR